MLMTFAWQKIWSSDSDYPDWNKMSKGQDCYRISVFDCWRFWKLRSFADLIWWIYITEIILFVRWKWKFRSPKWCFNHSFVHAIPGIIKWKMLRRQYSVNLCYSFIHSYLFFPSEYYHDINHINSIRKCRLSFVRSWLLIQRLSWWLYYHSYWSYQMSDSDNIFLSKWM
jgi:hypothetical protein